MSRKWLLFTASLVGLAVLFLAVPGRAADEPDVRTLGLEIAALQALHDMELNKEQLQALAKLAEGAAASLKPAKGGPAPSPAFKAALTQLRDALIKGKSDKIAECRFKLDEVARKEKRDPDIPIEPTETARKNVMPLRKLLTVSQLGNFVGALELTDPLQRLFEGAEEINGMTGDEKNELRDQIAEEVGRLVGGMGPPGKKVTERVAKFLDKVAAIKEDAFEKRKADLEKEARQIVGELDSLKVLEFSVEYSLAEFLSNPRLDAAITAFGKK